MLVSGKVNIGFNTNFLLLISFCRYYFLIFPSCAQRPATTTAKRLAKLGDVVFVGSSFFIYLYFHLCHSQTLIF
jgi:hypothetical protein